MWNLSKHKLRYSIFKNTSAQAFGKLVSSTSGLIFTLIIAFKYGPNGYGDFIKITTYLAFYYLLCDFGINAVAMKKWSDSKSSNLIFESLVNLRILLSLIFTIIALIIIYSLPNSSTDGYTNFVKFGILLLSPTIFSQAMITTSNAFFQKIQRYDFATISLFVGSIVSVTLLIFINFILPIDFGLLASVLAVGIGYLITAAMGFIIVFVKLKNFKLNFNFQNAKSLLITSLPLGFTLLFNLIYFKIDSFILTIYRPTSEVGIYGFVYKFFEVILVLPTFFMNSIYPIMLLQKNSKFYLLIRKSAIFLFSISIFISIITWFTSPMLTLFLNDFSSGVSYIKILTISIPIFYLTSLTMWILIAKGKQKLLLFIYSLSMIISIISNLIYVPIGGALAASWITVFTELFVLVVSFFVIYKNKYYL